MRTAAALTIALAACGSAPRSPAPWGATPPSFDDELAALEHAGDGITSFRAHSVMDFRSGGSRTRTDVQLMGKPGSLLRLQVLSPAGGDVLVDLACDGTDFVLVDHAHNCVRRGACDYETRARVLHTHVMPDDLFQLATGTVPVIHCGPITGTVSWDERTGRERIGWGFLEDKGERCTIEQEVELDVRDGHRDVVAVADGNAMTPLWRVDHAGYHAVETPGHHVHRVPGRSRYRAGGSEDLLVEWTSTELNVRLPPTAFQLVPPAGLPTCP